MVIAGFGAAVEPAPQLSHTATLHQQRRANCQCDFTDFDVVKLIVKMVILKSVLFSLIAGATFFEESESASWHPDITEGGSGRWKLA